MLICLTMAVSLHAQYQNPEASEWNSACDFITYTCIFLLWRPNLLSEKGLFVPFEPVHLQYVILNHNMGKKILTG